MLYKYPQAAFPYDAAGRGEPAPRPRRAGVRADRHRRLRRGPLLRRVRRVRQGRAEDILIRDHGRQPRAGGGARCTCCRTLWFRNTWSWGRARRRGRELRGAAGDGGDRARPSTIVGEAAGSTCEGAPELLFTENETNTRRLFGVRRAPSPYVKDGFNDYVVHGRAERGEPGATRARRPRRTTGRDARAGRDGHVRLRLHRPRRRAGRRSDGLRRRSSPTRMRGGRRVLRDGASRRRSPTTRATCMRQAFAGHALVASSSTTTTCATGWTATRPQPPPPPERQARPQPRLDAPLQRRRHLDAGQVGVSLVRRLGPGLPLHPARAGRPGLRQGAAHAAAARVVHAPERPAPGLRVGLRRRQPAGPRLGRVARLQDRASKRRGDGRPRVPGARLPQAAAELHLVGQPQGRRGAATSSRAASSAWTTSASSTAARRCRPAATSSRPTAPAGWRCSA